MSLGQTSKWHSLVPSNATEFQPESRITFEVPPNISFVKGKDCYLSFEIANTSQMPCSFYNTVGASSIINRITIHTLNTGVLLEDLNLNNCWKNIENQYCAGDEDQLILKQGCSEQFRVYNAAGNYTAATNVQGHVPEEQIIDQIGASRLFNVDRIDGTRKEVYVKYCIPLVSGVFNHFDLQEKLTPVLLLNGLRIDIEVAPLAQILNKMKAYDGLETKTMQDFTLAIPPATANNYLACQAVAAANVLVTTSDQDHCADSGFSVGARISMMADDTAAFERNILAMAIVANKLQITFDGGPVTMNGNVRAIHPTDVVPAANIKNLELKVLEIVPPREMLKSIVKESQFDFTTYETFIDNLPLSSLNHNVEIPSITEKGKAVFTHFINNTTENHEYAPNYYVGLCPTETNLNRVQYFMGNKYYPLRAYNPNKLADRIVSYNELVKAMLSGAGKSVKRLGSSQGSNKGDYSYTYLTGRELARGDYVFSLKDAEAQLRLNFSAARAFNTKLYTFVFSVRTVMINNNGVSVVM